MPACLLPSVQLGLQPSQSIALAAASLASGATATSTLTLATTQNLGTTMGIDNPQHDAAFDQFHTQGSARAQLVWQKAATNNTALPNHLVDGWLTHMPGVPCKGHVQLKLRTIP